MNVCVFVFCQFPLRLGGQKGKLLKIFTNINAFFGIRGNFNVNFSKKIPYLCVI